MDILDSLVCNKDLFMEKPDSHRAFSKGKIYIVISKSQHYGPCCVDDVGKQHYLGGWTRHFEKSKHTLEEYFKTHKRRENWMKTNGFV